EDAQRFLSELYEHVNEVNALEGRMAANHPELGINVRSTDIASGFKNVHDLDEVVPIEKVQKIAESEGAPDWLKKQVAAAQARGQTTMDVSKFNPDVVAGMATQGKADPWAMKLHNLSPHHSDFAPLASGAPNPNWAETVADQINAMRQPRIYRPY